MKTYLNIHGQVAASIIHTADETLETTPQPQWESNH
jgi:hypothetical protein